VFILKGLRGFENFGQDVVYVDTVVEVTGEGCKFGAELIRELEAEVVELVAAFGDDLVGVDPDVAVAG